MLALEGCNRARLDARGEGGHYESWFVRANHRTRPLAFWIRYTLLVPKGRPADATAEVWAIWFDGESGRHVALKESVPLAEATYSTRELDVRIGLSALDQHHLEGRVRGRGHTLRWQLDYAGDDAPLLLLDRRWYRRDFPKAKALVALPNAHFFGGLSIDGVAVPIDGWIGSQNHNWGRAHTDRYAWGQVAGFDGTPHAFLECATAWLKVGAIPLPGSTVLVLRADGREWAFNRLAASMLRSSARLAGTTWELSARSPRARVTARFEAAANAFVALSYEDPPGGVKQCLNSKIASCVVTVVPKGEPPMTLVSRQRAAFEILGDRMPRGLGTVSRDAGREPVGTAAAPRAHAQRPVDAAA
ncbi:MAG TPA: hypothetical protein VMU47_07595 [Caldimonas sp.]|nr:hypothetical protein [Caldimonas sp.]